MTEPDTVLHALIEELPPAFFDMPLECIFADNFRCRALCKMLDRIADGVPVGPPTVQVTLRFLRVDFASHVADEEQTFFPLLRERVHASDDIEQIFAQLRFPPDLYDRVGDGLEKLKEGTGDRVPQREFCALLRSFVSAERRHVSVENVVLLPLARRRLTAADLTRLGIAMRSRRLADRTLVN